MSTLLAEEINEPGFLDNITLKLPCSLLDSHVVRRVKGSVESEPKKKRSRSYACNPQGRRKLNFNTPVPGIH
ncbi:hypothetical protein VNO77_19166 [Canavalia gladiata]|uniref:Uncharacterized protein n=1 Tax=Canavalia gladiata TaxID=3824 RepID=A0AAN9QK99_CANGL